MTPAPYRDRPCRCVKRGVARQASAWLVRSRHGLGATPILEKYLPGMNPDCAVYTVGLESMGLEAYTSYADVRKWFRDHGFGYIDFVENCIHFGEPPENSGLRDHPGFHAASISHMMDQKKFRRWLWNFKQIFVSRAGTRCQRIVLFCRHGRHRSVAASRILQLCLEDRGCRVTIQHLGEKLGAWDRMRCQGTCGDCMWEGSANRAVIDATESLALETWRSILGALQNYHGKLPCCNCIPPSFPLCSAGSGGRSGEGGIQSKCKGEAARCYLPSPGPPGSPF